jgi:hypothetical protein
VSVLVARSCGLRLAAALSWVMVCQLHSRSMLCSSQHHADTVATMLSLCHQGVGGSYHSTR